MPKHTHTPGPWPLETVKTSVGTCHKIGDELLANARLISAAPEMLAALEMVRDADNDCHRDGLETIPRPARQKIDAALAKARGT